AEFWNAMTRPATKNGPGLTVDEAEREVRLVEIGMRLLADSENVYREWRRRVVQHSVSGVQVHDARLVAAMQTHGVKHVLTLNESDFKRYPEITALHPSAVPDI